MKAISPNLYIKEQKAMFPVVFCLGWIGYSLWLCMLIFCLFNWVQKESYMSKKLGA